MPLNYLSRFSEIKDPFFSMNLNPFQSLWICNYKGIFDQKIYLTIVWNFLKPCVLVSAAYFCRTVSL